jgi:Family of unknown function (DUF5317)
MIVFVLLGLLIVAILRRNPLMLLQLPFVAPFLLLLCLAAQIVLGLLARFQIPVDEWLLPLSFVFFLFGLYLNRKITGVPWVLIGCALNCIALFMNHGRMPVLPWALHFAHAPEFHTSDQIRHEQIGRIRVLWIVDWIPFFHHVLSPGDAFVGIGLFRIIVGNSRKRG